MQSMKSAYVTLGVPGNADIEDIAEAYQQALRHFSKDKLVSDPTAFSSLQEVKEAYKILSNPDLRKALDRKLNGASTSPAVRAVYAPVQEKNTSITLLKIGAFVVIGMFAIGTYFSVQRENNRKISEAREIAERKQEEERAVEAERARSLMNANRLAADAQAARNERQLRAESSFIAQRAQIIDMAQQRYRANEERMSANAAAADEANRKRLATEVAAQRAAADQRALRTLCTINTGKPNC
jgi:curved DNA-binding protein CbpA